MNKLSVILSGLLIGGFSASTYANTEISQGEMEAIKAECAQDSRDAIDPNIYAENCVEDKLQALKEQSSQNTKEKS